LGLLRGHLDEWWSLALVTSGGVAALAPALLLETGGLRGAELWRLVFGFTGTIGLVVLAVLRRSSLASLVDCLVVYPQSIAMYFSPPPPRFTGALGFVAIAVGIAGSFLSRREPPRSGAQVVAHVAQGARLLFGAYTLLGAELSSLAFVWLILLPPPRGERSWTQQVPRLILAWLAVLEPLQVFPVAGGQVFVGTQPLALLGLVCCGDGAAWLSSLLPTDIAHRLRTATAMVVLLATIALARADVAPWRIVWDAERPLDLPGSTRLRLPSPDTESIRALTALLRTECARFIVLPGVQSLYFWAQEPPPAPVLVTLDTRLMRDADFVRLATVLAGPPGACLVRCRTPTRQLDSRLDALYARARLRRSFGQCIVYDYHGHTDRG
jgi:hypothetical protein